MKKKIWMNEKAIRLKSNDYHSELAEISLNDFPVIKNFIVETKECGKDMGRHLYFINAESNRKITSFPWWDHVENFMSNMKVSDIPLGTRSKPFWDAEQGWQLIIFEKRGYVYILQGNEPCCTEFQTWYCVEKEIYIAAWNAAMSVL